MKRYLIFSLILLGLTGAVVATVLAVGRPPDAKYDRRIVLVAKDMAFFMVDGQDAAAPNPRLMLVPGEQVLIEFRNEDAGMRHDLVFEGLAVRTRILEQGEVDRVMLHVPDAEAESHYTCSLHPKTMRGQVAVGPFPRQQPARRSRRRPRSLPN